MHDLNSILTEVMDQDTSQYELQFGNEGLGDWISNLIKHGKYKLKDNFVSSFILEITGNRVRTNELASVMGIIKENDYKTLAKIDLPQPEKLEAGFVEWGEVIFNSITKLQTIDKTSILPITAYLKQVINNSGTKLLSKKDIKLPDIKTLKDDYKALWFKENLVTKVAFKDSTFGRLYKLKDDFKTAGEIAFKIDNDLDTYDFEGYLKAEKDLLDTVRIFNEYKKDIDYDKKAIAEVTTYLRVLHESLEFLAVMLFESQRFVHMFNEHQSILKAEL